MRRIKRRRIGAGLVQAEIAFRQIGEIKRGCNVPGFAFSVKKCCVRADRLLAAGAAERRRCRCAQAASARAAG